MAWLFYELSAQPKIVQKLRAEILDYVGPTRPPTYDDLKSMKYLQVTPPPSSLAQDLTLIPTPAHPKRDPPPLPRRSLQRPPLPKRHHPPARRRTRRLPAHRYPKKHTYRLLCPPNAPPRRPLSPPLPNLPPSQPFRARTLG